MRQYKQKTKIPRRGLSELNSFTNGLIAVGSNAELVELFPDRFYRMVTGAKVAEDFPAVACPAIHYTSPIDRQRYDIIQIIRTLTLLREEHPGKRTDGRLHFRSPEEMAHACKARPEWIRHTNEIAELCHFELPFGKPQFPAFHPADGSTAKDFLWRLVMQGLQARYGSRARQFRAQAIEELSIISDVSYEDYFVITWDFLQECRRRGIEWITRGSAADSPSRN